MRRFKYLDELTEALDVFDYDRVVSFLSDDCYFQAGNLPPVIGKQNISNMLNSFRDSLMKVTHRIDDVIESEDSAVYYGEVSYKKTNGFEITVPVCDVFKLRDNKIEKYYIFIDWSALLSN